MKQLLWIGCLESDQEFENKAKKGFEKSIYVFGGFNLEELNNI